MTEKTNKLPECGYGSTKRECFDAGAAKTYARWMVELSFKRPLAYFLWYRWYIPMRLTPAAREELPHIIKYLREGHYLPFWAECAHYHPILTAIYLLFQSCVSFLSAKIK